jgi:hypothetical protein
MSRKLSGLRRRLAKAEQQMAGLARREELVNCNCKLVSWTVAGSAEEFEAEMNLPCPSHGFRRLGMIFQIVPAGMNRTPVPNPRMDELIATYEARLAQADRDQAHGPEEYESDES